ncbi:hypothetical protein F8388_022835 [Cannabis sativa]|uniref:Retrotransposon gag domain-containing protein n=1 Tax=Cannabis sativa TaxID=3483 RepID=A0A7J6FBY7_CANSA|nr:hypothetical protein F8388_022835 [Cannabis sativa]
MDVAGIPFEFRSSKIELPLFDVGDDPDEWAYTIEWYFSLQHLTPAEKLSAAIHCLGGEALSWFGWENRRHPFETWNELKSLLLRRFRSQTMHEGSVYDRGVVFHRGKKVQEYHRRFKEPSFADEELSQKEDEEISKDWEPVRSCSSVMELLEEVQRVYRKEIEVKDSTPSVTLSGMFEAVKITFDGEEDKWPKKKMPLNTVPEKNQQGKTSRAKKYLQELTSEVLAAEEKISLAAVPPPASNGKSQKWSRYPTVQAEEMMLKMVPARDEFGETNFSKPYHTRPNPLTFCSYPNPPNLAHLSKTLTLIHYFNGRAFGTQVSRAPSQVSPLTINVHHGWRDPSSNSNTFFLVSHMATAATMILARGKKQLQISQVFPSVNSSKSLVGKIERVLLGLTISWKFFSHISHSSRLVGMDLIFTKEK